MKKLLLIIIPIVLFFGCDKEEEENNNTSTTGYSCINDNCLEIEDGQYSTLNDCLSVCDTTNNDPSILSDFSWTININGESHSLNGQWDCTASWPENDEFYATNIGVAAWAGSSLNLIFNIGDLTNSNYVSGNELYFYAQIPNPSVEGDNIASYPTGTGAWEENGLSGGNGSGWSHIEGATFSDWQNALVNFPMTNFNALNFDISSLNHEGEGCIENRVSGEFSSTVYVVDSNLTGDDALSWVWENPVEIDISFDLPITN
tara:strand:+ start:1216 stop:1995 length:780 start_codon:yes stop_codon:yes gene_type:complete